MQDGKSAGLLSVGEQVDVHTGPFSGMKGEVLSIDTARRGAKVRLTIFGRPVEVDVKLADLSSQRAFSVEQLEPHLHDLASPEMKVRQQAAEALRALGLRAKAAVPELMTVARADPRAEVRAAAIVALGRIDPQQATPMMVDALSDRSRRVVVASLIALRAPRDAKSIDPDARAAVRALLRSQHAVVREEALRTMSSFRTSDPRDLAVLVEMVATETDFQVRERAAFALSSAGTCPPGAEEALLGLIEDGRQDGVILGEMGYFVLAKLDAFEALATLLDDDCFEGRVYAAKALARSESSRWVPAILGVLAQATHVWDQQALVRALGEMRESAAQAVSVLVRFVRESSAVREHAARSLVYINAPEALVSVMDDADPGLRAAVVDAMAPMRFSEPIRSALLSALSDTAPQVRKRAIVAAQTWRKPEVIAALEAARGREMDDEVRDAMDRALERLRGMG